MNSTKDLQQDHLLVKRLGKIAKKCSDALYSNVVIPIEDIKIISVLIQEFVNKFHHGKEEKAYFPHMNDKNDYSEDIRKFLIEHELGEKGRLSEEEHSLLMKHYKVCSSVVGGKVRVEQMIKLIGYLEEREWMRK